MEVGDHHDAYALLDALPFATWRTDGSGRLTAANASFVALCGGVEVPGLRAGDVLQPHLAVACDELTAEVLGTGVAASAHHLTHSPSLPGGTVHDMDVHPVLDERGGITGTVGVVRDVTRDAVEERVWADHTAFQRLVMGLAVEFVNVPLDGVDAAIDEALCHTGRFTGVDRAYLFRYDLDVGTTTNTHEWCADGVEPMIDRLQDVPLSLFPEWLDTHRRGEVMHVPSVSARSPTDPVRMILEEQGVETVLAVPLTDGGRCLGFVGFDVVGHCKSWTQDELALLRVLAELFTNAQVRREHEHVLVEARRTAELASSAKSRFLSVISHELRTPMHGVLGMAELLSSGALTAEQRGYADVVVSSARSLLSLLDDLLETARIEAGRVELQPRPMRLRRLMDDVSALTASEAGAKPVSVVFAVDHEVPDAVIADELRLRQILTNLAGNAVKFTPSGDVRVELHLDGVVREGRVPLRFEVADTGVGIDPARLPGLFAPFTQAEDTSARRFGGIGLGLSIVHELTRLMGGEIRVETQPGVGTSFVVLVTVGLDPRTGGAPIDGGSVDGGSVDGRRVLIVEDNEVNQAVARAHLEDLGCVVTVASDGESGLRAAVDGSFDLVLMDCFMPVIDGFETARRMQRELGARVPIVALTANATEENAETCRAAGMQDVLTKPYGREELAALLHRWTQGDGFVAATESRDGSRGGRRREG